MATKTELERVETQSHLGFIIIKGDLGGEVIKKDPSITPDDQESEEKIKKWLSSLLVEYALKVCGVRIEVVRARIIKGLSKEQLVELYGKGHGEWMDSLTEDDLKKQMEVFDGTMAPIILTTIRVDATTNATEAEEKLIKVRNFLRQDWHKYLGKKEVKLPGGSKIILSAMHVGNYDRDQQMLQKYELV